jgi:hypothetical protein
VNTSLASSFVCEDCGERAWGGGGGGETGLKGDMTGDGDGTTAVGCGGGGAGGGTGGGGRKLGLR